MQLAWPLEGTVREPTALRVIHLYCFSFIIIISRARFRHERPWLDGGDYPKLGNGCWAVVATRHLNNLSPPAPSVSTLPPTVANSRRNFGSEGLNVLTSHNYPTPSPHWFARQSLSVTEISAFRIYCRLSALHSTPSESIHHGRIGWVRQLRGHPVNNAN